MIVQAHTRWGAAFNDARVMERGELMESNLAPTSCSVNRADAVCAADELGAENKCVTGSPAAWT